MNYFLPIVDFDVNSVSPLSFCAPTNAHMMLLDREFVTQKNTNELKGLFRLFLITW
jgi:hypothetical protein